MEDKVEARYCPVARPGYGAHGCGWWPAVCRQLAGCRGLPDPVLAANSARPQPAHCLARWQGAGTLAQTAATNSAVNIARNRGQRGREEGVDRTFKRPPR